MTVPPDVTAAPAGDAAPPDVPEPPEDAALRDVTAPPREAAALPAARPGVPVFDVAGLLREQLAEGDEPWELTPEEVAGLPRLGEEPPPELDEVPWWLSEEF